MSMDKFNYEENKGLEENSEIEFDVDSFDSDENSIDTSADEDLEYEEDDTDFSSIDDEDEIDFSSIDDEDEIDFSSTDDEDDTDFSSTDDDEDWESEEDSIITEDDFDSDEDSIDTSADFFNGSSSEPLSFNGGVDDFFEGAEFSSSFFGDNSFGEPFGEPFEPFESVDTKQMKKFLSKWFKIFAGLGVCLTVLGVLLNNALKRK